MCTYRRPIRNNYGQEIFVNCGRCPACLQAKANSRAARIVSHRPPGSVCYFVTLTYYNDFCPYITPENDADSDFNIVTIRRGIGDPNDRILEEITLSRSYNIFDLQKIRPLRNDDTSVRRVGVLYYQDLKNFFKRLRITLQRKFNYNGSLTYYACSEYGPTTLRPHFHALIWVDQALPYVSFKNSVIKSWPFADQNRTGQYVEVARSAARYVAAYVNCNAYLPELLKDAKLRPRCSHSLGFALDREVFSLKSILTNFLADERRTTYDDITEINGVKTTVAKPLPPFVVSRFFPEIRGFSRLNDAQRIRVLQNPSQALTLMSNCAHRPEFALRSAPPYSDESYPFPTPLQQFYDENETFTGRPIRYDLQYFPHLAYGKKELQYTISRIERAYKYFSDLGINRYDFARIVVDFLNKMKSDRYRELVENDDIYLADKYFNLSQVRNGSVHSDLIVDETLHTDSNTTPLNLAISEKLTQQHITHVKQSKLNDYE